MREPDTQDQPVALHHESREAVAQKQRIDSYLDNGGCRHDNRVSRELDGGSVNGPSTLENVHTEGNGEGGGGGLFSHCEQRLRGSFRSKADRTLLRRL